MLKIEGDQRDFCMFIVCVFYYFFCFVWEGRYVYSWRSNGFIRGMENSGATGIRDGLTSCCDGARRQLRFAVYDKVRRPNHAAPDFQPNPGHGAQGYEAVGFLGVII